MVDRLNHDRVISHIKTINCDMKYEEALGHVATYLDNLTGQIKQLQAENEELMLQLQENDYEMATKKVQATSELLNTRQKPAGATASNEAEGTGWYGRRKRDREAYTDGRKSFRKEAGSDVCSGNYIIAPSVNVNSCQEDN